MNVNIRITEIRETYKQTNSYTKAETEAVEHTVAAIDGELDRTMLAATLRALAESIEQQSAMKSGVSMGSRF